MATTISNVSVLENNYDATLEDKPADEIFRRALAGERAALAYCTGRPQAIIGFQAVVSTGTDVSIADLTDLLGLKTPPAGGMREFKLVCYSGGAANVGRVESYHSVKNVAGTISVLESAAQLNVDEDAGGGGGVKLTVSGSNVSVATSGTTDWGDDTYDRCQVHIYTKITSPILATA